MMDKFLKLYEKHFYIIILLLFISITILGIMPLRNIEETSILLKTILNINSKIFKIIRDYRYILQTLTLLISSIYVFLKGEKRNKLITVIAIAISILTFIYSLTSKQHYFIELEIRHIVAFPLFFIFLNVFEIFRKRNGKKFIEELVFKTVKIISLYIAVIFLLGKITNLYCISYSYFPYGYSGRFTERNAVSHVFVMILPLLMFFFYKKKEYKTLFYILISIVCALLIGTKSAYIGVYVSLILFILVSLFNYIKIKTISLKKIILISIILVFLLIINEKLYAPQLMRKNIETYTTIVKNVEDIEGIEEPEIEYVEKINTTKVVLKGRQAAVNEMWWVYNHQPFYVKMIGIGFYYPKYQVVSTEMDICDILFRQGILGLLLYLYTASYYITLIIKNIKNNFKSLHLEELLFPLTSVAMTTLASIIAGHVIYNYITMSLYSLTIIFLCTQTKQKNIIM